MSRSNGKPEAEVIMNYVDGLSYSKHKMEDAFRPGGILSVEKPAAKSPAQLARAEAAPSAPPKRDDIDLIVHEFEISRAQAEKALVENGGDVTKALNALITAPTPP